MEAVSLKLEDTFLRDIEKTMKKFRYTTKTEFIRESIRDKINDLEYYFDTITDEALESQRISRV